MPIDYNDYPDDWHELSQRIRFGRAAGRCEGTPEYPDCKAAHGEPHPETGSKVILTVAHMDHDVENNDPANLRALCQRCHLSWDAEHHARNAARTRRRKQIEAGQMVLFKEQSS